jgi:hypothetical protein
MERVHRTWLREAREEGRDGGEGNRSAFEDIGDGRDARERKTIKLRNRGNEDGWE